MKKINFIFNIIVVIIPILLSIFNDSYILIFFVLILGFLFPKIRNIFLEKKVRTSLFYEITEFVINIYLLLIIIRSIFDPVISFNNYEVMMYNYLVIRFIYIILILMIMNSFLIISQKQDNRKIDISR